VVSQLRSLAALQDNKAALDRDIASLTEDSGPSAKERLLESIKTNNQEAAGIERATNEVQESIAKLNMRLAELEGQLGSTQNGIIYLVNLASSSRLIIIVCCRQGVQV
jgi:chromosome segregation ATPase